MEQFDSNAISFLNQFARLSWLLDSTMKTFAENSLAKGGVLVAIFWWGWFKVGGNQAYIRLHLISTCISCFVAIGVARSFALLGPMRLRPMHEEPLDFLLPYAMNKTTLEGWSSFPSDHAVLFFALSAGLFYVSKKAGVLATAYTTLFICLPRVYLGLHYPTDILAGALIGIVIATFLNRTMVMGNISQSILDWSQSAPGIFYPGLILLTFQISEMFGSSRAIARYLIELLT